MSFVVVIPARYASSRLPGKALADIAGKPLVTWCLDRARESGASEVIVAVDDARVAEAVGDVAVMTSPDHLSGTDRLAEVARTRGWPDDTIVVNMQGDEPLLPPSLLDTLAAALASHPRAGIATMATAIEDAATLFRESVVKCVLDDAGFALTFSRAPIPWVRGVFADGAPDALPADVPFLRHLGLYAYRASTLRRLSQAPPAAIELAESLEQLRALALGLPIHVTCVPEAPPHGVDTPEDLERVRAILGK